MAFSDEQKATRSIWRELKAIELIDKDITDAADKNISPTLSGDIPRLAQEVFECIDDCIDEYMDDAACDATIATRLDEESDKRITVLAAELTKEQAEKDARSE